MGCVCWWIPFPFSVKNKITPRQAKASQVNLFYENYRSNTLMRPQRACRRLKNNLLPLALP